jgi:hypothetical protein
MFIIFKCLARWMDGWVNTAVMREEEYVNGFTE